MLENRNTRSRRGFSLTECGLLIVVVGMLVAVLMPMLGASRSMMRRNASAENLLSIGQSAMMYANDHHGRLFSYSWRAGEEYILPDGRPRTPNSDVSAAAFQNVEILQRVTGRIDGQFKIKTNYAHLASRRYSHLVLMDYLNEPMGSDRFIDPEDAKQLVWAANPLDYRQGSSVPYATGPTTPGYDADPNWLTDNVRQRWTFGSSYQVVPSAWQPDTPNGRYIPVISTPHLLTAFSSDEIALADGRNLSEVMFNANKVWMHEEFDRDQFPQLYFGYDQARPEKLMFDGSVNSWASGTAAPSVVPEYGMYHWKQAYVPLHRFPVPVGGLGDQTEISQRYRWTFRGLRGIDYGPFSGNDAASSDRDAR